MQMHGVALILLHQLVRYLNYYTLTYCKLNTSCFKNNLCRTVQGLRLDLLWDKHGWNLCLSAPFASENSNHCTKDSENEKTQRNLQHYATP